VDKITLKRLERTVGLTLRIAHGQPIHIDKKDLKLLPGYLDIKTKTQARKEGLELKRGAKPIGQCVWRLSVGGSATGDLYLGASFKQIHRKK